MGVNIFGESTILGDNIFGGVKIFWGQHFWGVKIRISAQQRDKMQKISHNCRDIHSSKVRILFHCIPPGPKFWSEQSACASATKCPLY